MNLFRKVNKFLSSNLLSSFAGSVNKAQNDLAIKYIYEILKKKDS